MRYGDRIAMEVDVDPALLDCIVPKLTLQPLVENALQHGLELRPGAGRVVVRGWRDGADLALEVEDDGAGMDGARLAAVRARLEEEASRGRRSIGLANVHQRLKLYRGPSYGLTISSAPGEGTRVAFKVPWALRTDTAMEPDIMLIGEERNDDVSLAYRR